MQRITVPELRNYIEQHRTKQTVHWVCLVLAFFIWPNLRDSNAETNKVAVLPREFAVIAPPSINFFPMHDQQTIVDFADVSGEIDLPATVQFSIRRVNEIDELNTYWNGSVWSTNRADPRIKLHAACAQDFWFPAAETVLPKGREIPPGTYLICVSAVDRLGNEGRAAITVKKQSAASKPIAAVPPP